MDQGNKSGCPARNDIPRFLFSIKMGNFRQAFEILKETNPFSGGCGRFCDHPCETACNRAKFDFTVDIKYLERFASDYGFNNKIMAEPLKDRKNKLIAVIGSGPAGLSTAYFLARNGYDTVVYERHEEPGGVLAEGIPIFRYPVEIREYEIDYIKSFGVKIETNVLVDGDFLKKLIDKYDAIVVATGAQKSRKMNIPGDDLDGVVIGLDFLRNMHFDSDFVNKNYSKVLKKLGIGSKVAVIGGGYTAFDVARSIIRLGGKSGVYYRRSMDEMTAHPGEVQEAKREGVDFHFLTAPIAINKLENGQLEMIMQNMWLGDIDDTGRRKPLALKGSEYKVIVDNIITAIGETPELDFIPDDYKIKGFRLFINNLEESTKQKIFITGDTLQNESVPTGMVVRAVGAANETCIEIRRFFGENIEKINYSKNIASYDTIKTRYFPKESRVRLDKLSYNDRENNFLEVDLPLSEELAVEKAARCWNCGICIQCDWCRDYSNKSILKLSVPWNREKSSHFYKFIREKVDLTTRNSVSGCPRNAMAIVPYDNEYKSFVDEQYISIDSIKY